MTRLFHLTLVAGQLVTATVIVLTTRWPFADIVPACLCIAGVSLSVWALKSMGFHQLTAMPAPRAGIVLVKRGPYRLIRHPMYAGLILLCAGLVCTNVSYSRVCWLMALISILIVKVGVEERALQATLPGYAEYRRLTKRLVPFLW